MIRNIPGLPVLRSYMLQAIGVFLIAVALLVPGNSARAGYDESAGLQTETHYISPQFFFELEWDEPWQTNEAAIQSVEGAFDMIFVLGPEGAVQCILYYGYDLAAMLDEQIAARVESYDNVEVVAWDEGSTGLGLPYLAATLSYDFADNGDTFTVMEYIEVSPAYTIDLGDGILVTSLAASPETLTSAFEDAQATFVYNQDAMGPLFAGRPATNGDAGTNRSGSSANGSEEEYLATLNAEFDAITDSVDRFYALLSDPSQASEEELEAILNTWIGAYDVAQSLTPPHGYEEVHAAYLNFTGLMAGAALDLYDGDLGAATVKLTQALESSLNLAELLEVQTGSDLLDRKSG